MFYIFIGWNFTKILVDRNGKIVARFEPTDSMDNLKNKIGGIESKMD